MRPLPTLLFACLIVASVTTQLTDDGAYQLFDEFHEWRLRDDPEFATRQGRHEYDHQLTARSAAAEASRVTTCETYLKEVDRLLSKEPSFDVTTSLLALKALLQDFLDGFEHTGYLLGVDSDLGDPAATLADLASWTSLRTEEALESWLSRLTALPLQLTELTEVMRLGMERGITSHRLAVELLPESLRARNVSVEESEYFAPLRDAPDTIPEEVRLTLQERGREVVAESVLQPLMDFADFIEDEYLPQTRTELAASSLGEGFYETCLAKFTSDAELTPAEAHEHAMDELEHLEQEISDVAAEMAFTGSITEFYERLDTQEELFFPDEESLLLQLTDVIEHRIAPQLPERPFGQPRYQLDVVPDADADNGTEFVRYRGPTADGVRPARLLVNTARRTARFELLSAALAEAAPGRHMRRSHQLDETELPEFRRSPDDQAATGVAPSGWSQHAALADGWAQYAASLAGELGLGETPLERLGWLRRAALCEARLVVDTGVHALGWSAEQAEQFLSERVALSADAAAAELRRIVTSPGRAAACAVGAERLRRLRGRLAGQLGGGVDMHRTFDRIVLGCPGPLSVVERCVDREVALNSLKLNPAEVKAAASATRVSLLLTMATLAAAALAG
ncbi:uncharacterized protein LOC122369163 [Amphibalanus amphitrite]|uniref:uncharacterized protein LOC122369163 n=1 Tax=Amphibalanus amphitrite TaxID=1232801 RepID=UPI001C9035E4|nr:uncharacterized protein LOC122369163 [Amphibalanus amphitrite]